MRESNRRNTRNKSRNKNKNREKMIVFINYQGQFQL